MHLPVNVRSALCYVPVILQYVDKQLIPKSECLKDTVARALPFWYDQIVPEILVSNKSQFSLEKYQKNDSRVTSVKFNFKM